MFSNDSFGHEISPFQHQNLPNQMGNFFLPQTLPNHSQALLNTSSFPNYPSAPYDPISNQGKKDRHTKIVTAQGVRDRRVRLSMGIAREFFHLQDMLGYDKASMTLGWLLAKSKGAIQELALENQSLDHHFHGLSSFGSTKEDAIPNSSSGAIVRRRKKRRVCSSTFARGKAKSASADCKEEIDKVSVGISSQANSYNNALVAREKRAKARARARERTRAKLSVQFGHRSVFQEIGRGDSLNLIDESKDQGLHRSKEGDDKSTVHLEGIDVIKSHDLSCLRRCTGYSQNHPIAPRDDQGSARVDHLANLDWNIFTFPTDMYTPWET